MGRPPFIPTDEHRRQVKQLSAYGLTRPKIGAIIGCSENTLLKYFQEELKLGDAEGDAQVASWAFDSAKKGSVPMRIFLCKTRLRWTEVTRVEHEVDEAPARYVDTAPQAESYEEWKKRRTE